MGLTNGKTGSHGMIGRLVARGPAALVVWSIATLVVVTLDFAATDEQLRERMIVPVPATPTAASAYRALTREHLPPTGRSVILAYAPKCPICNSNMANWIDLIAELPPDVAVMAVTPDSTERGIEYWESFRPGLVTVAQVPKGFFIDSLGLRSTPTTILVENGRPAHILRGLLIDESDAVIEQWLSEESAESPVTGELPIRSSLSSTHP